MTNTIQNNQDPNVYAQQYADNKGISLDDAKTQLKSQYGDPKANNSCFDVMRFNSQNSDIKASSFNDPEFAVDSDFSVKGMFQDLLNRLHGNGGPQKPGDPQRPQDTSKQLPDQGTDPDAYAQQYADENGITLDEAKAELKSKYGDPQKPEKTEKASNDSTKPDASINPDAYAQQYADENGITLDEAKEILQSMYGAPKKHNLFS